MAAALGRKVARRRALRVSFGNLLSEIREELESEELNYTKLIGLKNNLSENYERLNNIDEEILNNLDQEEIENDVLESAKIVECYHELMAGVTLKLKSIKINDSDKDSVKSLNKSKRILPKLELPVFNGNPLDWQGFWDQFNLSIHRHEGLNDIDRFNYLKKYLSGQALATISGLSLSSENYKEAIEILTNRYGNTQVLVSAHMDSLLRIRKIKDLNDLEELRKLYNDIESCVRNLRSLKIETKTYGCLLIPILKEKLPDELLILISRKFAGELWTLDRLLQYYNEELQAKECCAKYLLKSNYDKNEHKNFKYDSLNKNAQQNSSYNYRNKNNFTTSGFHTQNRRAPEQRILQCVYCSENHKPSHCLKVTNLDSRIEILKKQKRCFICLKLGHISKFCHSNYSCFQCNGKHHISICNKKQTQTSATLVGVSDSILLQTAKAKFFNSESECGVFRILFDSGSQRSYITKDVCERLKLKTIRKEAIIIKTFGQFNNSRVKKLDVVQLKVKHRNANLYVYVEALCVPVICSPLQRQEISRACKNYPHISKLILADYDDGSKDFPIDLLVGCDLYHKFMTGNVIRGVEGCPVASSSVLGWVLSGPMPSVKNVNKKVIMNLRVDANLIESVEDVRSEIDELRSDLQKFWSVEKMESTDECVIHKFENDIMHNGERYVTKLPFKPDHDCLPDNYKICEVRLNRLKRQLRDKNLLSDYDAIFKEYETNKIIERVPENEIAKESGKAHYLAHRPVLRKDKETTKIRAVFDASCSNNGLSLNDCLYSGPNLLSKIFDVLLRFRLNCFAILADIKQAFLNIEISSEHKDYLRFLWYKNVDVEQDSELIVYRFLRVVFGLTSSPFLLNGTIRHHIKKYEKSNGKFVKRFIEDLYVDDVTSGTESVTKGKEFYKKSKAIMSEGGFNLRKWKTNSQELQNYFDFNEKMIRNKEIKNSISNLDDSTYLETELGKSDYEYKRVLGIEWDSKNDEFIFQFNDFIKMSRELKTTKRNILKISASIYDPLGIVSPITARLKTIFQILCRDKKEWDASVSGEIEFKWKELLRNVEELSVLRVKRFAFVRVEERIISAELHGFCDSSREIYCAVVYLRVKTSVAVRVFFLAAKTKVTPLKELSVPRLELLGCLLLSKLVGEVKRVIENRIIISNVSCWTDSEVALHWIKGKEKTWKPWVENRVVVIRKEVGRKKWRHVAGLENPADVPTRKFCFKLLSDSWLSGPKFLCEEEVEVGLFDGENSLNVDEVLIESKGVHRINESRVNMVEAASSGNIGVLIDIKKFSTLNRLIMVTGYVNRFASNLIKTIKKNNGIIKENILTLDEYDMAFNLWLLVEQFYLRNQDNYKKLSSSLKLFTDKQNILRLKGRFGNSILSYNEKYPIILRDGIHSYFTVLIIRDAHERVMHHGIEMTLSQVRARFWIIKGRKTVKNVLRKCVICKKINGRTMLPPQTPDLPDYRVNVSMFSFQAVGIDFAGPLYVKSYLKTDAVSKVYVLILTCASSRAAHLELTPDMKIPAFLRALKRFIARRGIPDSITCDNFKTFKSIEVKKFCLNNKIIQKFILPASPWWGGFYERLVRSVKIPLLKVMGKSLVTYEELQTVLCDIESVINSRPLVYMSEDDNEEALTPFHLMYGRNILRNNVESNLCFDMVNIKKRAIYLKNLINDYRKRFSKVYLNELKQQHLYNKFNDNKQEKVLKVNDIMLINDKDMTPRSQWRMARVVEVIEGKDKAIRGAKLKVISNKGTSKICFRPVQKLIPLEIDIEQDNKDKDSSKKNVCAVETEIGQNDAALRSINKRPTRQAALDGQYLRQLKEKYC